MENKSIIEIFKENLKRFYGAEPTDECNRYGIINHKSWETCVLLYAIGNSNRQLTVELLIT